jgi:hypothetical protein
VIIAVDPGKISGLAFWSPESEAVGAPTFLSWQLPTWEAIQWVDERMKYPLLEAVVCEDYIITKSTLTKTRGENWSLESIGALRYLTSRAKVEYAVQKAGDAKGFGTDAKLKRAGWWNPTSGGHANDAARHLLTYLARTKRLHLVL